MSSSLTLTPPLEQTLARVAQEFLEQHQSLMGLETVQARVKDSVVKRAVTSLVSN